MRRVLVLLAVVAALVVMAAGAVVAVNKSCVGGDCVGSREDDVLTGSANVDRIAAMEGNDAITGLAGSDEIYGDEGNDTIDDNGPAVDLDIIYADEGNDTINVYEAGTPGVDTVSCGPGTDRVFFNEDEDVIARNCEIKNPR